jgi:hypothetical protein
VIAECVSAVRLRMDWRPLAGLTPSDEGSLAERVLARVVLEAAVNAHNRDVERSKG